MDHLIGFVAFVCWLVLMKEYKRVQNSRLWPMWAVLSLVMIALWVPQVEDLTRFIKHHMVYFL